MPPRGRAFGEGVPPHGYPSRGQELASRGCSSPLRNAPRDLHAQLSEEIKEEPRRPCGSSGSFMEPDEVAFAFDPVPTASGLPAGARDPAAQNPLRRFSGASSPRPSGTSQSRTSPARSRLGALTY